MTYDPRQTFSAQQSAYGRASGVTSSKSNANKQAAKTMKAAGIGGLGGKPTTSAAQRIQDKFRRETQRDDDRSTPQKNFLGNLIDRVKSSILFAGGDPDRKRRPDPNPGALYTASPFILPAVTAVATTTLGPAPVDADATTMPRLYTPDTREFGTDIKPMEAPEKPESAKIDIFDPFKEKVKRADEAPGLMSPPSAEQPRVTGGKSFLTEAPETIRKTIESIMLTDPDVPYVIQAGDTLSEIAVKTGTTVKDLQELNKIKKANEIFAGDELIIPSNKSTKTKEDIVSSIVGDYVKKTGDVKGVEVAALGPGVMGSGLMSKLFGEPDIKDNMTPEEFDKALVDRIVELEGYIPEAKMAFKTDRYPTIGYGQSDSTVKLGQKTTQKQAEKNLKEKLIPEKIKTAKRLFPDFDEFSDPLKIEIVQGVFRGDFKKEHKTVKLINQKKWEEASEEFLNHKEYEEAKRLGKKSDRRGIVDRLEDISKAINKEQFK